ncbi:MAP7 domain-containing protein 2-like isoform X2 [Synchiropus splendidus]|uniref:MAP7 domain-containing protein 2-like isoform X2 n=1 Tax=Synchiropus splendidus TaxID=270530 RepID=UPI00237D6304|nr:MAP7 domain-containing protein 2-like isoform X2 [Synchiropus splendidus]
MAKMMTSCNAITGEKMAPPSVSLITDKRSPTNGHSSPARVGKAEKKPQINGYASPSHLAAHMPNVHAALEGYTKTDDRMRLAKERREERERSLAAREQLIREKERRARLQYERTVEERWRRLEEQRQKEELRRAAVEEKRRQQLEEERERLEALMRRSLERSLQLEQRSRRWGRGFPGDSENAPLSFSAASALPHGIASPLPAVSESAPCSPHRSPLCNARNPAGSNRAGLQGGSQSTPNTPKKERLRRERRTASPGCGFVTRRSESPASVTKYLASPTASKLVSSQFRSQSPSSTHQYNYSPTRHRGDLSPVERRTDNKKVGKKSPGNTSPLVNNHAVGVNKAKQTSDKRLKGENCEISRSPDRNDLSAKVESPRKMIESNDREKKTDSGKVAAGTTNAEEATRLLAERRRLARAQKELEEKKQREQEAEDRLKEEQQKKKLVEEQQQVEVKSQQLNGVENKVQDQQKVRQEEEKRQQELLEKELQIQAEREREKAKSQAQEEAERQRLDRELQLQHEEEERQLRKKRIEEIMKRTRKGDADVKEESLTGDVETNQNNGQQKEAATQKGLFQLKENATLNVKMKEQKEVKDVAVTQMDCQKSESADVAHQGTKQSVPVKRLETRQSTNEVNKRDKTDQHQERREEMKMNLNQQNRECVKAKEQINQAKAAVVQQREGRVMNGVVKGEANGLKKSEESAEMSKSHSLNVKAATVETQLKVVSAPVSPQIMQLRPLDVKEASDEVQSMEVSPPPKEELVSIPKYSSVKEIQHSGVKNSCALDDLMDLTGTMTCNRSSSKISMGDCNKNLIEGVVSSLSESKVIKPARPSSNKLNNQ